MSERPAERNSDPPRHRAERCGVAGDESASFNELVTAAAFCLPKLDSLELDAPDFACQMAPYLARFATLTALSLSADTIAQPNASHWPPPSFRLATLRVTFNLLQEEDDYKPCLAEFKWLTASSRESLRHLELEGFECDVVADISDWGHKLETIELGLFYWSTHQQLAEAAELGKLPALRRLTLGASAVQPALDFDESQIDGYGPRLQDAVDHANRELDREIVAARRAV